MVTMLCAVIALSAQDPNKYAKWGAETLTQIRSELYLADRHLYRDSSDKDGPAFNWGVGVMLSALDAAAEYDDKFKPWLKEYLDASEVYWNSSPPVAGYDVLPNPSPVDRYYDDNQWMAIDLADAARILGDRTYTLKAQDTMKFILSGKDAVLGGGIYWRENQKSSKNTCSNGPAATGLALLYKQTGSADYLTSLKDVYAWTHKTLRDPDTGLYFDNISVKTGNIQKWIFSYNTAMMIRSASQLYSITKDEAYGEQARQAEAASVKRWLTPEGGLADEGKFAHMLITAWLERITLAPGPKEGEGNATRALTTLEFLHRHVKDSHGHYPDKWGTATRQTLDKWTLIDQASAAKAYFTAALYLKHQQL